MKSYDQFKEVSIRVRKLNWRNVPVGSVVAMHYMRNACRSSVKYAIGSLLI